MNLIFRCSELHRLMGNAKSIDSAFLTEEVQAIKAKKKRTDEEQKILDDLLDRTLSATAKTLVKEKVRQLRNVDQDVVIKMLNWTRLVRRDRIERFQAMETDFMECFLSVSICVLFDSYFKGGFCP